ncbi:MAG: multiheme c-type cytochrome [Isosphaeraceae bacterium]|nr:multiheme c-type cytochrome [Isosphaeraceae bacterium]
MNDQPAPDPGRGGGTSLKPMIGRALIGSAVAAWVGAMVWVLWPANGPGVGGGSRRADVSDVAGYVGNRVCAECHPGEYAKHTGSGHAQTLSDAGQPQVVSRVRGMSVQDPEDPRTSWKFAMQDQRLELERSQGEQVDRRVVEYALGSGHHAITFVSLTGQGSRSPEGLEHRISYFAKDRSLGLTPGQRRETKSPGTTPLGRHFNAQETQKCFECHCTLTSDRGNDVLDVRTMVPNITCERCHGPAREHAAAARRGAADLAMPFGAGRWTAAEQMTLCGKCHRLPEFVPADQRVPENTFLRRFQSVGLMLSKCYTGSRGALSCVTCHDPHGRTATNHDVYNSRCVNCHQAPPQTTCRVEDTDCIQCHMPKREAGAGLFFADHWIRSYRE